MKTPPKASPLSILLLTLMALVAGNALFSSSVQAAPKWHLSYHPTRPNTAPPGQMAAAYMIPAHFDLRPDNGLDKAPVLQVTRHGKTVARLEGSLQRSGVWRYMWSPDAPLTAGPYQASVTSPQGKASITFDYTP